MKRLLCIVSNMNMGGAETFLMKVYRTIDKSKYQMDFCINELFKCAYEDEILSYGGKVFRIPSKSENRKEFKKQLTKIVRDNRYDDVLRITSNGAGFLDLKVSKKAGARHTIARSSNSSDGNSIKKYLAHRVGRVLWGKYVDEKVAPSDLAAIYTFGKKAYRSGQVQIINNGLDLSLFVFSEEERNRIRKEFGIASDSVVVGHIGRFDEQKNHSYLILVFDFYHKTNTNSKLLMVGNQGRTTEQIRKEIIEKGLDTSVILSEPRPDIPSILSAMDVLVMPSFYEGMPNTVLEAQATGLPCVISDTITREANITGLVHYLSLSDDISQWADSIKRVIQDNRLSKTQQMEDAGYSISKVTDRFLNLCFRTDKV